MLLEDLVELETTLFRDIWKYLSQSKPADPSVWDQAMRFGSI